MNCTELFTSSVSAGPEAAAGCKICRALHIAAAASACGEEL